MFHPFLALLTVGLLSIHQYIPTEHTNSIQYFSDVREAKASNIFPAANQSCLYLQSIFISEGLQQRAGVSSNSPLGAFLKETFEEEEYLINDMTGILHKLEYANELKDYNIEPDLVIDFLKKICKKDFSPLNFGYLERQAVLDLIQNEIHILSEKDLNSLGQFRFFGTIPFFDRHGKLLGSLNPENRRWVSYEEIPKSIILAVLAAEDRRFFIHQGSDEVAISRIASQIVGNKKATGGSTLTMQLLKRMYFESKSSQISFLEKGKGSRILRKVREWYWAKPFETYLKTEDLSNKKKILEYYFNLVDFGVNIQGIEQASHVYFSKSAQDLSFAEAAYLVTLLKGPNKYSNPFNYENLTKGRRNDYVLTRMGKLCSKIHQSQFLTDQKEVQSLMKYLCKVGGKKINTAFIEKEKQSSLPLWERPQYIELHESFIPIQRQIRKKLKRVDFSSPNQSKEARVKTTIDKNLQQILFRVMRSYLDAHDKATDTLSKVVPIDSNRKKDDYKMKVLREDIPSSLKLKLQTVISPFKETQIKWLYSIQINQSFSTFNFEEVEYFLKNISGLSEKDIKNLNDKIQSQLSKRLGSVGKVLFVRLEGKDFSIFTLSQMLEKSGFLASKINRLSSDLSISQVQKMIYKSALARVHHIRPRDELEPLLYLGKGQVINRHLEQVVLLGDQLAHLKNYSQGNFFWSKKEDSVYRLQANKIQAAAVIMNSKTGELLASFDGYNPKNNYLWRSSQTKRQIGSVIKPFTYFYVLDREGFQPQSILNNKEVAIAIPQSNRIYRPKNTSLNYSGPLALFQALNQSQNIATVSLLQDYRWNGTQHWSDKLNELRFFLQDFGLYENHTKALYPSMLLGAEEQSLSNIVTAFSFFANGNYVSRPYFIEEIDNYQNHTLFKNSLSVKVPYLKKTSSLFQIRSLLLQVANSGTAGRLYNLPYILKEGEYRSLCYNNLLARNYQSCFGGKTGTSDKGKDLWFVGFSEDFVIGIWVGYDIKRPTDWSSSQLVSIFSSIVQEGVDYLPAIKPILKPEDQPSYLEKRVVYGNQACSNPITTTDSSYVIFPEKGSEYINCQTSEEVDLEPELEACECIPKNNGYTLNITYAGYFYEDQGFFNTKRACEKGKYNFIDDETRQRVCGEP